MKVAKSLLALWLAAATSLAPAAAGVTADPPDSGREILVMLKMPAEHYRPGKAYAGNYGAGVGQRARTRIAARIANRHGLTLVNSWPMPILGVDCFVMRLPDGLSAEATVAQVSHEADVAWSQALQLYHTQGAISVTRPAARDRNAVRPAALHQFSEM